MMADRGDILLVFSTCPDSETGRRIATGLLDARLAACVTLLPGAESIYEWQGSIERNAETVLLIKTSAACFDGLAQFVTEHHPYELPEIIAVPVDRGLPEYLQWVTQAIDA